MYADKDKDKESRLPKLSRRTALGVGVAALAVLSTPELALADTTYRGRTGPGAVVNPAFDADGTGTATPQGWNIEGDAGASFTETTAEGFNGDAFQLTHWSTSAFRVDTWQRVTGLPNGNLTLGVWVRSSGGDNTNYVELRSGPHSNRTSVPVLSSGSWLNIVTSVLVTDHEATIHLVTDGNAGDWTNYGLVTLTPGYASLPIRGGDVSSLARGESLGGVYFDNRGFRRNALDILGAAGMNWARLRTWVNPEDGFDDEQWLLQGAREAKAHGMKLLLDFHYSDTWTDPGHQATPAAWANLDIVHLRQAVHDYSKQVVGALVRQGTPPDMVSPGNEINGGFLWPLGQNFGTDTAFADFASLLKPAIAGIKEAAPRTEIAVHIANAADWGGVQFFYDGLESNGVPFDVIALSYYTYYHGHFDAMQTTVNNTAARYQKPIVIAETAYPWTLASDDPTAALSFADPTLLENGYPATPAGQAAMFRDIQSLVQAIPGGLGRGVFYWEPTWTVVKGNGWDPTDPSAGDGWENQAMFDFSDHALPVISDYAQR